MCSNLSGANAPFCEPTEGAQFAVGDMVTVTWDPKYFISPDTAIRFQADVTVDMDSDNAIGQEGFTSEALTAGMGSYVWTVGANLLNGDGDNSTPATLFLSQLNATNDIDTNRIMGPVVELVMMDSMSGKARALEIALPIVFGLLLLSVLGGFFWYRRRHPGFKLRSLFTVRHKERTTHEQWVKSVSSESVVEVGMSGAGGGRNVFREEIQRQERMG